MAHAWGTLLTYLRTGRPGYEERFGLPFREDLAAHPGVAASFDALMGPAGHGAPDPDLPRTGQSFFDPLPAGYDVYLLHKVLNDWPGEETTKILGRCAEAARPEGRVLVAGGVAPDEAPRRLEIEMVLVGGQTDTLSRFRRRAAEAGLEITATGHTRTGRYVVECRPRP